MCKRKPRRAGPILEAHNVVPPQVLTHPASQKDGDEQRDDFLQDFS
jgi:hypothetical protein